MSMKYLALLFSFTSIVYCSDSSIQGDIIDANSREPLMGANIILKNTMLGAASNENGHYIITKTEGFNF